MPFDDAAHTLETPERVTLSVDLAGVGSRGLACLLDTMIIIVGLFALILVFALLAPLLGSIAMILAIGAGFLLQWFYFTAFESIWNGQTPGKRAVGVRVQKLGGYPIGWTDAMIRNFMRLVDFFMLYGVGIIVMLLNEKSQRIGDLAAGTVVVRERSGGAEELERIGYRREQPSAALPGTPELTAREYEMLSDFLARRDTLEPAAYYRIQHDLADALRSRLAARGALRQDWSAHPDAAFLYAIASASRGEGRVGAGRGSAESIGEGAGTGGGPGPDGR